jgi:hypothetical protein
MSYMVPANHKVEKPKVKIEMTKNFELDINQWISNRKKGSPDEYESMSDNESELKRSELSE